MESKRGAVILAGLAFAKESNPQDEFFVVNFNNYVVRGLPPSMPFTDDLQTLRSALYYGKPVGQTALYDATADALKHLEHGHRDKRTLIIVSDGGDNVSKLSLTQLMPLVEGSRATIYTVGLFDPEDRDLNPAVLRKLSSVSGGEYFQPQNLSDVIPIFHKISKDIRNRYSIGYVPDVKTDKRQIRSVKVTAHENGQRLIVRTRTTYTITPLSDLLARQEPAAPGRAFDKND
jgi:VWFA-related protein